MQRVYVKKPADKCRVEGCENEMKARGMCDKHYRRWHRATLVKPTVYHSHDLILQVLPGTMVEIAEATGLHYETVLNATGRLHEEGKIHIDEWSKGNNGYSKYVAIYDIGPGPDAKQPSRRQKLADRLESQRANYHRRKLQRAGEPMVNALFGRAA